MTTDDELRVEIAKRCGCELRHGFMDEACINPKDYWITPEGRLTSILPDYPRDLTAAIALLDSTGAEYAIEKQITEAYGEMKPLEKPIYHILIFNRNPIRGVDYNSEADTLPRAACLAWLAWHDGKEAQNDIRS